MIFFNDEKFFMFKKMSAALVLVKAAVPAEKVYRLNERNKKISLGKCGSANIVIKNSKLERQHCFFKKINNDWTVQAKYNCLHVNGTIVKPFSRRSLKCGDKLKLPKIVFKYKCNPDNDLRCCCDKKITRRLPTTDQQEQERDHIDNTLYCPTITRLEAERDVVECRMNLLYLPQIRRLEEERDHALSRIEFYKEEVEELHQKNMNYKQKVAQFELQLLGRDFLMEIEKLIHRSNKDDKNKIQELTRNNEVLKKRIKEIMTKANKVVQQETAKVKENFEVLLQRELQCSICKDLLIDPVVTNCKHIFCKYCIRYWLSANSMCPLCRTDNVDVRVMGNMLDTFINSFTALLSNDSCKERQQAVTERRAADS